MKIALCEDEKIYIEDLTEKLSDYISPDGERIRYDVYENAFSLLDALESKKYDAIILDIIMQGMNGMDAARDIRRFNVSIPIIFLTSSTEYAVESYRVHAFDYLLKPVKKEELFETLSDIYALCQAKGSDSLTVNFGKGTHIIPFDKLVYLEIRNRVLFFHMLNGDCMEAAGRISDYEEILLSRSNYLKIHRSIIINMDHMKSYDRKSFVSVTGETLPVSRTILKEVQTDYMNYLHEMVRMQ